MSSGFLRLKVVLVLVSITLLSSCANWNAVYRTDNLGGGTSLVMDATQRVVINNPAKHPLGYWDRNQPTNIICAEPSPDVAMAMTAAFQAAAGKQTGSTGGTGIGTNKNLGASMSFASATAIAQLGERLSTVQLLRDETFSLCQAYANGMVTAATYAVRLSKLDDKMVTLLMGEMQAGAFGRQLATAGGTAATLNVPIELTADQQNNMCQAMIPAVQTASCKQDADTKQYTLIASTKSAILNNVSASAPSAPGGITGRPTSQTTSLQFAVLQQNYLDEDDTSTMLTACIATMDQAIPANAAANAIQLEITALQSIEPVIVQGVDGDQGIAIYNKKLAALESKLKSKDSSLFLTPFGRYCQKFFDEKLAGGNTHETDLQYQLRQSKIDYQYQSSVLTFCAPVIGIADKAKADKEAAAKAQAAAKLDHAVKKSDHELALGILKKAKDAKPITAATTKAHQEAETKEAAKKQALADAETAFNAKKALAESTAKTLADANANQSTIYCQSTLRQWSKEQTASADPNPKKGEWARGNQTSNNLDSPSPLPAPRPQVSTK